MRQTLLTKPLLSGPEFNSMLDGGPPGPSPTTPTGWAMSRCSRTGLYFLAMAAEPFTANLGPCLVGNASRLCMVRGEIAHCAAQRINVSFPREVW
jgi:hypothetical protein